MAIGLRHKCFNTNRNLSKESSKKIRIPFSIYDAMNLLHAPNLCTQCVFRQLPERFSYCGTTHFIFVSKLGDLLQQTCCNACQVMRHANLMEMKNVTKFLGFSLPQAAHLSNQTINSGALFMHHRIQSIYPISLLKLVGLTAPLTFPMNRET